MKGKQITVLHFDNVSFELEVGNDMIGNLNLILYNDDYRFEWRPASQTAATKFFEDSLERKTLIVQIRLCEIMTLTRINESMKTVALELVLQQKLKLPPLRFHNVPDVLISHMFEFLVDKNFIVPIKSSKTHFTGNIPPTRAKYTTSALTAYEALAYVNHKLIIKQLIKPIEHFDPISYNEAQNFFDSNKKLNITLKELKEKVFYHGLTEESRYLLWPYILGIMSPDMDSEKRDEVTRKLIKDYQNIRSQYTQLLQQQIDEVPAIIDTQRTIANDVNRTDRMLPQFKDANSPWLQVVSDVLQAYSIFNRDTDYVQGMGDILVPILLSFIKSIDGDAVTMSDGSKRSLIEAEAIVFANYAAFMDQTQHQRMFTDMADHQELLMERVMAIAAHFHRPLVEWMKERGTENLGFLYRPYLLLFKREFPTASTLRLWDAFVASESPHLLPRFFLVALFLKLFPWLLLESDGSVGEAMAVVDSRAALTDPSEILQIACELMHRSGFRLALATEPLPSKCRQLQDMPTYFHLAE